MFFNHSLIIVCAVFVGTWFMSSGMIHPALTIGVVAFVFLIFTFYEGYEMSQKYEKEDDLNQTYTIGVFCGWIWLVWVSYGLIAKDVVIYDTISLIYGVFLLGMVVVTYIDWAPKKLFHAFLLIFFASIFVPNQDGIYALIPVYLLYLKVVLFVLLYVTSELSLTEKPEHLLPVSSVDSVSCATYPIVLIDQQWIYRMEIKLIRSAWVLFALKYLLIASFFQMAYHVYIKFSEPDYNKKQVKQIKKKQRKRKRPVIQLDLTLQDLKDAFNEE